MRRGTSQLFSGPALAMAWVIAVSVTACGSVPATISPSPAAGMTCQAAEEELDGLMQSMLTTLGFGPQFTSQMHVSAPQALAVLDDVHRRTDTARKQHPRLQVLWDRAAAAAKHFRAWEENKQAAFLKSAASLSSAGLALSAERMVCEPT